MAIAFSCPSCDRTYSVGEKYGGKVVTCKTCEARMLVPDAEEDPEPPPKPRALSASPPPLREPPRRDPTPREQAEAQEVPRSPGRSATEDDAFYAKRAARKQRRKERDAEIRQERRGNSLAVSRTVVSGITMMGIAVICCAVGLMNNVFIYITPVLFLFGLVTLVKGLMGRED